MGYPMASNLIKKIGAKEFLISDHIVDVAKAFRQEHPTATVAESPIEIAKQCSIIVTMLPASPHVRSVYLGEKGLVHGIKPGSIVIDSSTIDPSTAKDISNTLKAKGVSCLDAPVSGGILLMII